MAGNKRILAVTQRRAADDAPTPDALYNVGVIASVIDLVSLDDGTMKLMVNALERAAIINFAEGEFLTADTAPIQESRGEEEGVQPFARGAGEAPGPSQHQFLILAL